MKLLFLIEKLENSAEFSEYKSKNPSGFLCAGFFILDLDLKTENYQLDYSDSEGNITTFHFQEKILMKSAESLNKIIPQKVLDEIRIDIDNMQEIAKSEAIKNNLKLNKIIAVLQNLDGKIIWNLNCMSGLKILILKIDANSGEILKSEVINLFDIAKVHKKN